VRESITKGKVIAIITKGVMSNLMTLTIKRPSPYISQLRKVPGRVRYNYATSSLTCNFLLLVWLIYRKHVTCVD
jgi:hypothetical protein